MREINNQQSHKLSLLHNLIKHFQCKYNFHETFNPVYKIHQQSYKMYNYDCQYIYQFINKLKFPVCKMPYKDTVLPYKDSDNLLTFGCMLLNLSCLILICAEHLG